MVSSPGIDGKPRKFTPLPNLASQVANCFSQPAWMKKPSPGAIARTGASIRVICAKPAATPWIDTQRRYGVFLYLKGLAPNYVAAARLWAEVARACNEQFDVSTSDRSLPAIRPASRR